ncbi:hypothetical protein IEU95_07650 [Hoyosella rhizosphaerae]|uniref:DUF1109 domain-containing protein n=1 Tax=Hoyosella rhizosphaerae TaxID=1755582 RepID=A0A916X9E4_9ACTN|nr:hypothetical protein [Hoyosella rhizosphaerae]MBN4926699.1 hypothetical protein [Hoyosella rhizosphaerae]GGC57111.1 hypothetical protein GCM10011410_07070 [Hoyosella rhizosphaerae]
MDSRPRKKFFPGGPILFAVTAIALALLVAAVGHWWPRGSLWYAAALVAVLVLLATALAWAIDMVRLLRTRQALRWRVVVWPLIVVIGVGAAFGSRPSFENHRQEFTTIAVDLLGEPGRTERGGFRIGRFDVARAYDLNGNVFFVDARETLLLTEVGWVFSPDGEPHQRYGDYSTEHVSGPWYRYSYRLT